MRLLQSLALIIITTSAVQAQRLVKLNLLEKSPLANMVVYSMNDSTANYTKLVAGTGIQITYNENDTTLTITATGTSVGVPQTLSLDDGTRVLSISDGNSVDLSESIQEEVNAMLVAGDNVTLTYNDVANTLTIASTGGGGGATNIGDLGDVTITSATTGQVLKYDGAAWINGVDLNTETLSALTDVDTTGKTDGSIILYDAISGNWEAQANSINNLTDGYRLNGNLVLGRANFTPTPSAVDYNSIFIGNNAGNNVLGYANTAIGGDALTNFDADPNTGGNGNTAVGEQALKLLQSGFSNVAMGREAGEKNITGDNNVFIGRSAGYYTGGTDAENTTNFNSGVFLGAAAYGRDSASTNEIVIGSQSVGNGSNTATLGNNNITATYLKGTTNLRGYGAGNKEAADLSKTATDYVLRPASDGTILEQINNVDGLTDAEANYTYGSIYIGNSNVDLDASSDYNDTESTFLGINAGPVNPVYANTGVGINVLKDADLGLADSNTGVGANALVSLRRSNSNVAIGRNAMKTDTSSFATTALGMETGIHDITYRTGPTTSSRSIYVGFRAKPLNQISRSEIVIGTETTGHGDSTVTIGKSSYKGTYLNGNLNLNGYGLGNKEAADIGKTASAYIAGYATDGTLIELPSSGLGISLTDLSVTQNSPGTAGLTYNNTNGVFTYTPPDLSSYLTAEVDGSVTNEIQDLSLTGNVLSLSGDATTVDLTESVQDEINNTITAGEGISVVYDDGAGTLTISAPSGAGNTDEQTLSINNATAELSISNGNTVDLSEAIDNQVNNLFVDGTNILSTYDDISNSLTVRTTDALTQIDAISFDNNVTDAVTSRLQYNADAGTFVAGMANNVPIKIGQDIGWYVKNNTASTIPKGTAVMAVGADGNSGIMLIDEMVFDGSADAKYFLGVTAEAITSGSNGFVISQGVLKGFDTSLISPGSVLYGDPTTPGGFVTTEPTGTNLKLPIANTLSQTNNGTIAIRVHTGLYMKDIHDVDITGVTNNSILKYNSTGGYWDIATDLVDDADADPTNEIQDLSLTGNTLSLSGDATTVDLSPYLDEATTASNGLTLSGTDVKLGGTLSDATTTIDMNSNALTFTNNGGYNLSGTGGLSFTNTSATDYSSVLSIAPTNTRIYADGGTTEPLNSLNLTSTRSGVKELDLRSSISNDNTTYTMIALNPTRFSMKTPNVTDLTATNGQFLKLVDRLTGEVEFADALTAEVDGSVTNEIQDLSLTGNTLSLSSDATTVDLSPYLDDQTVTLTGGGITAISGTYPNFTITSTEVDGSVSNEGLLSASTLIAGTTAALTSNTNGGSSVNFTANTGLAIGSSGGNTITFTNTLPEATTASNGLTETGNNIALGGDLTGTTIVDLNSQNLYLVDDGATGVGVSILPASNEVAAIGNLSASGDLLLTSYGLGNNTGTSSGYLAGFASDGTMIEIAQSTFLTSDQTTASNGLTLSGTNVKLGGTLTEITNIAMGGFNASIFDVTSSTGLAIQPSINEVIMYGTQSFTDYGSGNKEAGDLSKAFSGHYAGFATDGTVIEVNALPITTGTSPSIDWGNMPQRIHVLDFGANTSLTLSFSNVLAGGIYTLRVTGNSGTDTLVWPAAAKFEDGSSVGTVTLQNGGQMFTFYWDGTNYWVK